MDAVQESFEEMKQKLSEQDEHLDPIEGGGYHCDTCFPGTCSDDAVVPIRGVRYNAGVDGSNMDICADCYAKLSDSDKKPFQSIPVPVLERCIAQAGPGNFAPRRVVCSDPCSARGPLNYEFELMAGNWHYVFSLVRIEPEDLPIGDRRIGLLGIYHQDCQALVPDYRTDGSLDLCTTSEEPESLQCAANSGRFGFFNADTYMKDTDTWEVFVEEHFEPEDPDAEEGVGGEAEIEDGRDAVVVTSGFGDGVYSLKVHKNENGQLKAAYCVFVDDQQEQLARQVCGVDAAEASTCLPCTRVDEGQGGSKEAEVGAADFQTRKRRKTD